MINLLEGDRVWAVKRAYELGAVAATKGDSARAWNEEKQNGKFDIQKRKHCPQGTEQVRAVFNLWEIGRSLFYSERGSIKRWKQGVRHFLGDVLLHFFLVGGHLMKQ